MPKPSPDRRFPPPWSVIEVAEAFVVVDAEGTRISFTYFDETPRGANSSRKLKPDALKIASAIARLPDVMRGEAVEPDGAAWRGPSVVEDCTSWFTVSDADGNMVCCVYVDQPTAGNLSWDEARRIASGIARLPDL